MNKGFLNIILTSLVFLFNGDLLVASNPLKISLPTFASEEFPKKVVVEIFSYLPQQEFKKMSLINKTLADPQWEREHFIRKEAKENAIKDIIQEGKLDRDSYKQRNKKNCRLIKQHEQEYKKMYGDYFRRCFVQHSNLNALFKKHQTQIIEHIKIGEDEQYGHYVQKKIYFRELLTNNQLIFPEEKFAVVWFFVEDSTLESLCEQFESVLVKPKRIRVSKKIFEECFKQLKENGILKNRLQQVSALIQDQSCNNLLHRACKDKVLTMNDQYKCVEVIKLLCKEGAHVNSKNNVFVTPLHETSINSYISTEKVKFLLENDANPNSTDKKGKTPLHRASGRYNSDNIKLLLKMGAHVNCEDHKDRTPLHRACIQDTFENVYLLVNAKADVNKEDNEGKTPWDYARTTMRSRIPKLKPDNFLWRNRYKAISFLRVGILIMGGILLSKKFNPPLYNDITNSIKNFFMENKDSFKGILILSVWGLLHTYNSLLCNSILILALLNTYSPSIYEFIKNLGSRSSYE